ncbi:MAG: GNAT family N-acetyltransferase [Hyphomicrobiaceae bacterium]|nr:GNAT family N-acetyltransferase [Hyphomicrobiaceae bacterium]
MIGADTTRIVRRARTSDGRRLADIFAETWRLTYQGIIPHAHLECLVRQRGKAWWTKAIRNEAHLLIIEVGGEVAGYATCGAARSNGVYKGEIYELYIAPHFQGLGLGEHLFEACRSELDARSLDGLIVWALEDNPDAGDFYQRRGGRPSARSIQRFGPTRLGKIAYTWR